MLAAHRAGLKVVILPKRNEADLDDIPEDVRKEMEFVLVERVDELLKAALRPPKEQPEAEPEAESEVVPEAI